MSLREDLNIAGRLTLRLHTADGRVADERVAHNDITLKGRELVARLFNADLVATDIPRVSRIVVCTSSRKGAATCRSPSAPCASVQA